MPFLPEQSLRMSGPELQAILTLQNAPCSTQPLLAALQCKFILLGKLDQAKLSRDQDQSRAGFVRKGSFVRAVGFHCGYWACLMHNAVHHTDAQVPSNQLVTSLKQHCCLHAIIQYHLQIQPHLCILFSTSVFADISQSFMDSSSPSFSTNTGVYSCFLTYFQSCLQLQLCSFSLSELAQWCHHHCCWAQSWLIPGLCIKGEAKNRYPPDMSAPLTAYLQPVERHFKTLF